MLIIALYIGIQCSKCIQLFGSLPGKEMTAETAGTSSTTNTGSGSMSGSGSRSGAVAAHSPAPDGSEPSTSKAGEGEGEGGASQAAGEDKDNDAAAVTAVIWKELAELSAAQAKLKVSTISALLSVGAGFTHQAGGGGGGQEGFGNAEGSCSRQQGLQALCSGFQCNAALTSCHTTAYESSL